MIDFLQNHNVPGVGSFFDFVPRGSKLAPGGYNLYELNSLVLLTNLSVASSRWQQISGENPSEDSNNLGLLLSVEQWGGKSLDAVMAIQIEKVINGDFLVNVNGWTAFATAVVTWDNGRAHFSELSSWKSFEQTVPGLTVDGLHQLTYSYEQDTNTDLYFMASPDISGTFTGAGPDSKSRMFISSTGTITPQYRNGNSGGSFWADDISIKEIPALAFLQPNAPEVPKFYANPSRIVFDGVDDNLEFKFASGAGPADCSVFCLVKSADLNYILFQGQSSLFQLGYSYNGSGLSISTGAGSPSTLVDNGWIADVRRDLNATTDDDLWHLIEFRNCDFSAWTSFNISGSAGSLRFDGSIGRSIVIIPTGQELSDNHDNIIYELIRGYGVTLA